MHVDWKLHRNPTLYGYDVDGKPIGKPIELARYDEAGLHKLFSEHFVRENVPPPSFGVRTWRRLFGWAYGISFFEATLLFVAAGVVVGLLCYAICFRYTAICDSIQDI